MPRTKQTTDDLLREILAVQQDDLIVKLALAGVTQHQIREIVGVDMRRVGRIVKHLRKANKETPI